MLSLKWKNCVQVLELIKNNTHKNYIRQENSMVLGGWMDGRMDGRAELRIAYSNQIAHENSMALGGWMDGWMDGRAGLRIAYSNKNIYTMV